MSKSIVPLAASVALIFLQVPGSAQSIVTEGIARKSNNGLSSNAVPFLHTSFKASAHGDVPPLPGPNLVELSSPDTLGLEWSTTVKNVARIRWTLVRLSSPAVQLASNAIDVSKTTGLSFSIRLANFLPPNPPAKPQLYEVRLVMMGWVSAGNGKRTLVVLTDPAANPKPVQIRYRRPPEIPLPLPGKL